MSYFLHMDTDLLLFVVIVFYCFVCFLYRLIFGACP